MITMKPTSIALILLFSVSFWSCKTSQPTQVSDNTVPMQGFSMDAPPQAEVTFLHINDVYEISPLEGGEVGGMARVATLRKQLKESGNPVYTVLAGDFLNPSVIGTVKLKGERINGAQMVDIMNKTGVDYVSFGNHEFDLDEEDLQKRINESEFEWISSNTFHKYGKWIAPFEKEQDGKKWPIQPYKVVRIPATSGPDIRMGIISVCLPANRQPYVEYHDMFEDAKLTYNYIADKTDFVVALTHLSIDQDKELARRIPQLALIMGGHEHENHIEKVGNVVIAKADANAKSAYVHNIHYDGGRARISVGSELIEINTDIAQDEDIKQEVELWEEKAFEGFKKSGFDINKTVATLKSPLDGRESTNRFRPASMGIMVAEAIYTGKPGQADASLINSGSIRIDDVLSGKITEFDIIRMLPFGGSVYHVEMSGKLLAEILEPGLSINKGSGGYLQLYNISWEDKKFKIGEETLDITKTYRIAMPSFLLTGLESNLDFLTEDNPEIKKITKPAAGDSYKDIRLVVIDFLKNR